MAVEDLNLVGIKNLDQALGRTRNGAALAELSRKLGLWTQDAHDNVQTRPQFPARLSDLTPSQLSDLNGRWTAEYGRVLELCGIIGGQEALLKIALKSAIATARQRARKAQPDDAKPLPMAALADLAEEDPAVIEVHEQLGLLALLSAVCSATKEATAQYLATISREISFRDAQLKAGVY